VDRSHISPVWRRLISIGVLALLAFSVPVVSMASAAAPASQQPAYLEFRVMKDYGKWVAPSETATSILSMISSIRASTGNRLLDMYAIVAGPQIATEKVGTTTLDDFLTQAKQAAGGQVIPDLNLNYYTSDLKSLDLNQKSNYCDPHNKTFCGPAWFFTVSSELLSLKAVSTDPQRTVSLDAWDQFNRDIIKGGLPASTAITVLQQLKAQGWVNLMLKTENYFSDNGNACAQIATVDDSTSAPYMQPELSLTSKLPSTERAFVHFDRQNQNSPDPITALAAFLSTLKPAQQALGLTNLASLESTNHYTFIYPVLTYTARNSVSYTWDATVDRQSNGQPFIYMIESLINKYG